MNDHVKKWLIKLSSGTQKPKARLICFPFAGGGTINYTKWRSTLNSNIEFYGLNLPGRERFFGKPCLTDYKGLIKELAVVIQEFSDCPMLFFGHSFGGITAYLTALELKTSTDLKPAHVFISARVAPGLDLKNKIASLEKEQFKLTLLERYQGIPQQILNCPELLNLFIPIIQADFRMYEQYFDLFNTYLDKKIDANITTIRYLHDLPEEKLFSPWKNYTTGIYNHMELPGSHFEIINDWQQVVTLINQTVIDLSN